MPFKDENSKFLITNDVKQSKIPPKIFKIEPSSVLSRVKGFLPKMKEAEEMLEKEIAAKSTSGLDIENIADGAPYIEMNLALVEAQESSADDSLEESSASENGDSDAVQTQEIDFGHVTDKNFVISKAVTGHKKPVIEDISKVEGNGIKKFTKRTASKEASRKRKQR